MNVIIGFGVVGQHLHRTFQDAHVHDPALGMLTKLDGYDVGFVCVPTERKDNGEADTSIVLEVVAQWSTRCRALCIKSTVPPGTTDRLLKQGYNVLMSPEFAGATQHSVNIDDGFVILGGPAYVRRIVAEQYKRVKPATFRILATDATTAELVKYGENAYLAAKVVFVNEFARICSAFGVDFDEWRELWLADPRIEPSHTFVYRDHPYYSSHCLDKDIPAIIAAARNAGYRAELIEAVDAINARWRAHGGPL